MRVRAAVRLISKGPATGRLFCASAFPHLISESSMGLSPLSTADCEPNTYASFVSLRYLVSSRYKQPTRLERTDQPHQLQILWRSLRKRRHSIHLEADLPQVFVLSAPLLAGLLPCVRSTYMEVRLSPWPGPATPPLLLHTQSTKFCSFTYIHFHYPSLLFSLGADSVVA